MDGLLIDSEKLALETFQATCEEFELGDLSDVFMQCVGTNAELNRSILENGLKGLMDSETFEQSWHIRYARLTQESPVPLKKGAKTLLEYLERHKIPRAVATSSNTAAAQKKLENSGILKFFKTIVGGDQVVNSKPDPECFLKAARLLAVDPATCAAFEDSPNGVRSAVAAGMTVVQIPDLIEPDDALLKLGHIVLSSLAEAIDYDFGPAVT